MDKSFRSSRKRVLPVDSTPHNSQTNSQEKKKTTPKFVPPLKKALTSANQCLTHHPAAVLASQELPSSQGSSIHLPADSQGSSIDLSAGSQGSSIELSFNDRQTADSIDKAASPAACPPPKRSFRAAAQRSRHTYTLTKSHVGQLDKRAVLQSSMAAAPSLGVFDFPISQNHQAANTSSRADITCDADQSTGNLFRLNASMTGRSLEQQIATDIEVLVVIERTCAEINEIRRKYSITAQQLHDHGTRDNDHGPPDNDHATTSITSSTSQEKDSSSSQPYMSLFFSQYEE